MRMDLYIYYRVLADHATQFANAAAAMQTALLCQHRISSALKRRPEIEDGHHTWMEVYQAVPDDFMQTITQAVADSGVASFIEGQRHHEWFITQSESISESLSEFSSTGSSCV